MRLEYRVVAHYSVMAIGDFRYDQPVYYHLSLNSLRFCVSKDRARDIYTGDLKADMCVPEH